MLEAEISKPYKIPPCFLGLGNLVEATDLGGYSCCPLWQVPQEHILGAPQSGLNVGKDVLEEKTLGPESLEQVEIG